jgi:uncharacterized protein involved in response to NO
VDRAAHGESAEQRHHGAAGMNATAAALPASVARLLAAAPHRSLFLVGAANVLLAMGWWAAWLTGTRTGWFVPATPPLPAGWMHAIVMQYQVLPPFIFGFLLTVFPRWLDHEPLGARHYLPVGAGLLGGQLLTLLGLGGNATLLLAGASLTLAGWCTGTVWLARVLVRGKKFTGHAVSIFVALCFGIVGLGFYLALLVRPDGLVAMAAIKIGGVAVLVPIYFTVCHRMIPFFTSNLVPGYRMVRPMWTLVAAWTLLLAHLALELTHRYTWLWVADAPLALLTAALLFAWWPRAPLPPLLRVLFLGFAWLPVAFVLFTAQSVWFAATGEFVLGRAPAHALFVGFFGSLLVAMVTRVTQGHSGRPLELGSVAAVAFVLLQLTAVIRIVAEFAADSGAWQAAAAIGWLVAFLPWVLRSGWIYLTPRADGHPG